MQCAACYCQAEILSPLSNAFDWMISRYCNAKLAERVFNLYICQNSHLTIACRKCGIRTSYFDIAMTHHIASSKICTAQYRPDIHIKSIRNKIVNLSVQCAISLVPQLLVLDIDYISAFKNEDIIDGTNTFIHGTSGEMYEAIKIIKKQQTSCNMCGMFYECFPSLELALEHVAFRCAK